MQKEAVKIIGVTESTIWNWENGWNIQQKYLKMVEGFWGDGNNDGGMQNSNTCPLECYSNLMSIYLNMLQFFV